MLRVASRVGIFLFVLVAFSSAAFAYKAGERRYNYVTKKYEFYDGSDWYNFNIGLPLGGCTREAEFEFNNTLSLYQYCNGTNWIRLVGIPTLTGCSGKAKMDYFSNTYMYCNGLVWVNLKGAIVL